MWRMASNALNHDRPHLQTHLVSEGLFLQERFVVCQRENAVVVRPINSIVGPNK
jgi:hypothetical protein